MDADRFESVCVSCFVQAFQLLLDAKLLQRVIWLDPGLFVRVHRSHIVAIPHVTLVRKEGDGAIVELDGPSPHRVPVSRAKIAEVKARLGLARRHA